MDKILDLLREHQLTRSLSAEELEVLASHAELKSYSSGQSLFDEGQPRRRVGILSSGGIEIRKEWEGKPKVLYNIWAGDSYGEGVLIDDFPHSTTAISIEETEALELTRTALTEISREHPEIYAHLATGASRVISSKLRVTAELLAGGEDSVATGGSRREKDLLGERELPDRYYYGIQTLRAMENFPITGIPISQYHHLISALAVVKEAAAAANAELGLLEPEVADAIMQAAREIREGKLHDQFLVDVIQGGAGTSTNMNANEVIANRALEILGHRRGEYDVVHPNNHVNLSQSTNDAYPTALRIAANWSLREFEPALAALRDAFKVKAEEFSEIVKMGRTQLQDAVPMTVGQEFNAFATTLGEEIERLREIAALMREINMGATAIGTGINTNPRYAPLIREKLREITGLDLSTSRDLVEASSDVEVFVILSGVLKRVAVKLSKICNDLRLLSSGPRAGLGEINLPAMQPGSSIMPGKVNPVIPEVVNQVCYQVIGNDMTVTIAAEGGQLQLNVFETVIAFNIFQSVEILKKACIVLREQCVTGITVNHDRVRHLLEHSIGIVTALVPVIGYERATTLAKEALETDRGVYELVLEKEWLTQEELDSILTPEAMTRPRTLSSTQKKADD